MKFLFFIKKVGGGENEEKINVKVRVAKMKTKTYFVLFSNAR